MKSSILFVCLGNICRSALAEGTMRNLVGLEGLDRQFEIESAGTGNWHVGNPPDNRAVEIARLNGVDISMQRARQFEAGDLDRFNIVLAMDGDNLNAIEAQAEGRKTAPQLFLSFAGIARKQDVPDPYFGGIDGFHEVYGIIDSGCRQILDRMRNDPR